MLHNLLNVHVLPSFSRRAPPKPPTQTELQTKEAEDEPKPPMQTELQTKKASTSALKIIQAGGIVESYYMAVPAKRIIAKYPSFMLAKPDVFRRPWESVVRPDQILKPGEKFYLIPRRTLEKLLRKTKKPNKDVPMSSFVSQTSNDPSCVSEASGSVSSVFKKKSSTRKHGNDDASIVSGSFSSSFKKKSSNRKHGNDASSVSGSFSSAFKKKSSSNKKHVRFVGIDIKPSSKVEDKSTQRRNNAQAQFRKRRPRHGMIWQPTLNTISEKNND